MSFDLDKVLDEETVGEPYVFTFDGEKYTLPSVADVRAVAAIAGGRLDDGLRLLLNPAQWEKIQASPKLLTMPALEKLFDDYFTYAGSESVGKPSGSTTSSKRTVRP